MPVCCVPYCDNKGNEKDKKITFHEFPHTVPLFMETWLKKIGRSNWRPGSRSVVCSAHFEKNDYDRKGKLRFGSCPTVFPESPKEKKKKINNEKTLKPNVPEVKLQGNNQQNSTEKIINTFLSKVSKEQIEPVRVELRYQSVTSEESSAATPSLPVPNSTPDKENQESVSYLKTIQRPKNSLAYKSPELPEDNNNASEQTECPSELANSKSRKPQSDSNSLPTMCRICGEISDNHIGIFSEEGKKAKVSDLVLRHLSTGGQTVVVNCHQYVCRMCISRLQDFDSLVKNFQKTSSTFQSGGNKGLQTKKDGQLISSQSVEGSKLPVRSVMLLEMPTSDVSDNGDDQISQAFKELNLHVKRSHNPSPYGRLIFVTVESNMETFGWNFGRTCERIFGQLNNTSSAPIGPILASSTRSLTHIKFPKQKVRSDDVSASPQEKATSPEIEILPVPTSARHILKQPRILLPRLNLGSENLKTSINVKDLKLIAPSSVRLNTINESQVLSSESKLGNKSKVLFPSFAIGSREQLLPKPSVCNPDCAGEDSPSLVTDPLPLQIASTVGNYNMDGDDVQSEKQTHSVITVNNDTQSQLADKEQNHPVIISNKNKQFQLGDKIIGIVVHRGEGVEKKVHNTIGKIVKSNKSPIVSISPDAPMPSIPLPKVKKSSEVYTNLEKSVEIETVTTSQTHVDEVMEIPSSMEPEPETVVQIDLKQKTSSIKAKPIVVSSITSDFVASPFYFQKMRKATFSSLWTKQSYLANALQKMYTWSVGDSSDKNCLQLVCRLCNTSILSQYDAEKHLLQHPDMQCVVCDKYFLSKDTVKQHTQVYHKNVKPGEVKKNLKIFYKKHYSATNIANLYQCPKCEKRFKEVELLNRHMMVHTEKEKELPQFSCETCDRRFETEEALEEHTIVHSKREAWQCDECGEVLKAASTFRQHKARHNGIVRVRKHKCDQCEKAFVFLHHLKYHKRKVHGGEAEEYMCAVCGKIFRSRSSLYCHEKLHKEQNLECRYCKRRFYRKDHLRKHETCHEKNPSYSQRRYYCRYCSKCIETMKDLLDHYKIEHHVVRGSNQDIKAKKFQCDICPKTFLSRTLHRNHVAWHSGQYPFKCSTCNAGFLSKERLDNHERLHTNERPFKCSKCEKGFRSAGALIAHSKHLHSDYRVKYQCELCDRSYARKTSYDDHKLSHTGQKPWKCSVCSRQFRVKGDLNKHINVVHAICMSEVSLYEEFIGKKENKSRTGKPWACTLCSQNFTVQGECNAHLRIKHHIGLEDLAKHQQFGYHFYRGNQPPSISLKSQEIAVESIEIEEMRLIYDDNDDVNS